MLVIIESTNSTKSKSVQKSNSLTSAPEYRCLLYLLPHYNFFTII